MANAKDVTAIIQARLNSQRLPAKVLRKISGSFLLEHVINRAKQVFDNVIVATPDLKIAIIAEGLGVLSFIGSEEDVLDRYYRCAKHFKVQHIARLTADNPLVSPDTMRRVVDLYCEDYDYVTNRGFPTGDKIEIFSITALELAWNDASKQYDREHVTSYMYNNPELFRVGYLDNDKDLSNIRWTVDTAEDLENIERIIGGKT